MNKLVKHLGFVAAGLATSVLLNVDRISAIEIQEISGKNLTGLDGKQIAQLRVSKDNRLLKDLTTAAQKINGEPLYLDDAPLFPSIWTSFCGGNNSGGNNIGRKFQGLSGHNIKVRIIKYKGPYGPISFELIAFDDCNNNIIVEGNLGSVIAYFGTNGFVEELFQKDGIFELYSNNEILDAINNGLR